jgi:hypothetical protein
MNEKAVLKILLEPEWDNAEKVHDWRNYVTEEVIKNWDSLDILARACIYDICEAVASNEEWE